MTRRIRDLTIDGLAVALGTATLSQISLGIKEWGGDFLTASYITLPANRPKDNSNVLYLWEGSDIPWGSPPDARVAIPTNAMKADVTFSDIVVSMTSYIVGYAPAPDPTQVCASVVLDAGGLVGNALSVSIGVASIGTTSVTIRYAVLPGYRPAFYGNWIGLWEGEISPYNCPPPLSKKAVKDVTAGTVTITDVPIKIDTRYTVVYFMHDIDKDANNTTAAAILRFDSTHPESPKALTVIANR